MRCGRVSWAPGSGAAECMDLPAWQAARDAGFNVTYGDGSRASVIKASGVKDPRAFAVVYTARRRSVAAVENLRAAFPDTPIWARALDLRCENVAGREVVMYTKNSPTLYDVRYYPS